MLWTFRLLRTHKLSQKAHFGESGRAGPAFFLSLYHTIKNKCLQHKTELPDASLPAFMVQKSCVFCFTSRRCRG